MPGNAVLRAAEFIQASRKRSFTFCKVHTDFPGMRYSFLRSVC